MRHVELLESIGFEDVILSLKASDVAMTVEANRLMAAKCDLPFHLGITEAGTVLTGSVRSSVGLGVLLAEGIGDTIRVSLSGPVEEEVRVGREILKSLGLRHGGVTVIACPTCGRCQIDVQAIAEEVEREDRSHPEEPRGGRHGLRGERARGGEGGGCGDCRGWRGGAALRTG